ncbi:hypothetical protein [Butyricimonas paravirosa]
MKNYIWFVLICFLAIGCNSEESELSPSGADRDWFVIEDSEDPIGHERFLLYEKYGIPVFVNDTIGQEARGMDYYGEPVIYYYVLDMNYTVGAPATDYDLKSRNYSLLADAEDQLAGLDFLDNYLIPALPEDMYFNSILLLDSLYELRVSGGWMVERKDLNVYRGVMTLAIGQGKKIAGMTLEEQKIHKGLILGTLALSQIDEERLTDFYMVSYDPVKKQTYYGQQVNTMAPSAWLKDPDCRVYGFLDKEKHPVVDWIYTNVNKAADKEDFVMAFFQYSEQEFKETYAAYPLVLQKYEIIKGVMAELGYI